LRPCGNSLIPDDGLLIIELCVGTLFMDILFMGMLPIGMVVGVIVIVWATAGVPLSPASKARVDKER
jgi:hypothetical protein